MLMLLFLALVVRVPDTQYIKKVSTIFQLTSSPTILY